MTEHEQKYQALAELLGWNAVKALIPKPLENIKQALEEGDEHLNKWGNAPWDHAAWGPGYGEYKCPACGGKAYRAYPVHGCGGELKKLFEAQHRGHSLSDGVCVLKHVAKVEARKL